MSACSTVKQDCSAGIKFRLCEGGKTLVVTEVSEDHNHEIDEVITLLSYIARRIQLERKPIYMKPVFFACQLCVILMTGCSHSTNMIVHIEVYKGPKYWKGWLNVEY